MTLNIDRIARGRAAIELHPDFRAVGIDVETAATDIIADVLHAVFATFIGNDSPENMLDAALRTYLADSEDHE